MRFTARIGVTLRTRIDLLAAAWNMTLAQAVRRIVILGLGGDETDVLLANEEAAGRVRQMGEFLAQEMGVERMMVGGPRPRSGAPAAIVNCAFGRPWAARVKQAGGLRRCIEAGLAAIGEGD